MSEQRKSYLTKSLFLAVAVILIAVVAHQPGYPSITRQIEKSQDLPSVNRSLSSRQTKKQKILLKMVSVICRGHLFMQHPASYGNSLVRGNLDDADAVGSCSNE